MGMDFFVCANCEEPAHDYSDYLQCDHCKKLVCWRCVDSCQRIDGESAVCASCFYDQVTSQQRRIMLKYVLEHGVAANTSIIDLRDKLRAEGLIGPMYVGQDEDDEDDEDEEDEEENVTEAS